MESTERVVISLRFDPLARGSLGVRSARRSNARLDGTVFVHVCRAQVGIRAVSGLCHIPPATLELHRHLGGTPDAEDVAEALPVGPAGGSGFQFGHGGCHWSAPIVARP